MIVKRSAHFGGKEQVEVRDVDRDFDALFQAISLISPGAPSTGRKCDNLDGVWILHTFGPANTDETLPHKLGRQPVGLIEVQLPPTVTGTAPVVGQVTFGSVNPTASLVTLRCSGASKRAAVILF